MIIHSSPHIHQKFLSALVCIALISTSAVAEETAGAPTVTVVATVRT
ncbi:MAG: hypothetical protein ABJO67_21080 [Pseudoruegeria sp.]